MTDKQRAAKVLELLAERYPDLETHLMAESPWELLVATVLAAQCTDKRVNQVTPELFRRWPDPAALAQATIPELEEVIHSVGFYHSKAKHLIAAAQLVVKDSLIAFYYQYKRFGRQAAFQLVTDILPAVPYNPLHRCGRVFIVITFIHTVFLIYS